VASGDAAGKESGWADPHCGRAEYRQVGNSSADESTLAGTAVFGRAQFDARCQPRQVRAREIPGSRWRQGCAAALGFRLLRCHCGVVSAEGSRTRPMKRRLSFSRTTALAVPLQHGVTEKPDLRMCHLLKRLDHLRPPKRVCHRTRSFRNGCGAIGDSHRPAGMSRRASTRINLAPVPGGVKSPKER
jgi:hypothetical protein